MTTRDLLVDTLRTIWAHKLRTALTMFGIAWGIISITLMVAAGEGLATGQKKVMESFAKDLMIFFAGRTSMQAGGTRAGTPVRWEIEDVALVKQEAPACREVLPELGKGAQVRSAFNSGSILVVGSLPPFSDIRSVDVGEGRFYSWEDNAQVRRVAFLGSDVKKQLFGGRPALGETVHINNIPYTVIGVMKEKEQDSSYDGRDITKIYVPVNSILRDFPARPPLKPNTVERLLITPDGIENHETCKAQARAALGRIHGFDRDDEEAAGVWDTIENAKSFRLLTDGMKYFLGAVGLVTLFLGGIGVMNVMLVAVRERTREIGVRKAVGATSRSIVRQFFLETAIIVFLSGGVGMGIAFGLCAAVNTLPMPMYFAGLVANWDSALVSFALLGVVAILSALYPAGRAASVDPIEALRHEAGG